MCSLAALVGISCKGVDNVSITPPNGYQPPGTLDPEIASAFHALSDPNATVDQRVGAVLGGKPLRAEISAGLAKDQSVGTSTLTIAGWKLTAADRVEILYALQTDNGPSTPWPEIAYAQRLADGHWYASENDACGIDGLAGVGCQTIEPETPPSVPGAGQATTRTAPASP